MSFQVSWLQSSKKKQRNQRTKDLASSPEIRVISKKQFLFSCCFCCFCHFAVFCFFAFCFSVFFGFRNHNKPFSFFPRTLLLPKPLQFRRFHKLRKLLKVDGTITRCVHGLEKPLDLPHVLGDVLAKTPNLPLSKGPTHSQIQMESVLLFLFEGQVFIWTGSFHSLLDKDLHAFKKK